MSVSTARRNRTPSRHPVAVALGSNVGDRQSHLDYAVDRLADVLEGFRVSTFRETAPEGGTAQPMFMNAVAVGLSADTPQHILHRLQGLELDRGRVRPSPYAGAPRTLDLDLILVGSRTIETAELTLPHPRFRQRRFVLEPLAEIAPDLMDPLSGLTVRELLERLGPS